jgi:uncharacterized DUF497 family protein
MRFEWDERKSAINKRKHRVSFAEAESVFSDDHALLIADPDHSGDEDRFIVMGLSATPRVLVVCHCYREDDDVVRIISARKANRLEQRDYEGRRSK